MPRSALPKRPAAAPSLGILAARSRAADLSVPVSARAVGGDRAGSGVVAAASPPVPAADEPASASAPQPAGLADYLEMLALVERLHRLLLDVIKDEFERLSHPEVNPVQALLLFNIGDQEVTAGELRSRGYYQGSNVSYNLKKRVEAGYMHHQRCAVDRRAVRIRLTPKGHAVRGWVADLFARHAGGLPQSGALAAADLPTATATLRRLERFWTDQIRYIY